MICVNLECGKEFQQKKTGPRNPKYCSRQCGRRSRMPAYLARKRERYAQNPEKGREQARLQHLRDPVKGRQRRRKWHHNMRESDVTTTRPRPDRCEVCGSLPGARALSWDHDHIVGCFRGWLCRNCNVVLGIVKDDPGLLDALASYLRGNTVTGKPA